MIESGHNTEGISTSRKRPNETVLRAIKYLSSIFRKPSKKVPESP